MRSALVVVDLIRQCGIRALAGWDHATVLAATERSFDGPRRGYDVIVSVAEEAPPARPAPDPCLNTYVPDARFLVDGPSPVRSAFTAVTGEGWLLGSYLSCHDVRAVDIVGIAPSSFLVETALDCAYRFFSTRLLSDLCSSPTALDAAAVRLGLGGVTTVTSTDELAGAA